MTCLMSSAAHQTCDCETPSHVSSHVHHSSSHSLCLSHNSPVQPLPLSHVSCAPLLVSQRQGHVALCSSMSRFHRDALDLHRDALIEAHWPLPLYDMSDIHVATLLVGEGCMLLHVTGVCLCGDCHDREARAGCLLLPYVAIAPICQGASCSHMSQRHLIEARYLVTSKVFLCGD